VESRGEGLSSRLAKEFGLKATRCFYMSSQMPPYFSERLATFEYEAGRDHVTQAKNSRSLIAAISEIEPGARVIEVSTASSLPLGVRLSALNLLVDSVWGRHSVEKVFQASKIFEFGGPFLEILDLPGSPKSHPKLSTSGKLTGFVGPDGLQFVADGTSIFYDRLYVSALIQNSVLLEEILNFDIFTDLRFTKRVKGFVSNQPINTQARSCAIAKSIFVEAGMTGLKEYVLSRPKDPPPLDTSLQLFDDWE